MLAPNIPYIYKSFTLLAVRNGEGVWKNLHWMQMGLNLATFTQELSALHEDCYVPTKLFSLRLSKIMPPSPPPFFYTCH